MDIDNDYIDIAGIFVAKPNLLTLPVRHLPESPQI